MTAITVTQINNAIENTLGQASSLVASQTLNELTEGIHDYPVLQVYWDRLVQDYVSGSDRSSFGAGVRQSELTFVADVIASPRRFIGQDIQTLTTVVDEIVAILEAQRTTPAFGLDGIKSFTWSADRIIIRYADTDYVAARFTISIKVF